MTIHMESIVVRGGDQTFTEIDGDVVMMAIGSGKYYGLSGIGSRIWTLIAQPKQVGDLCSALLAEFEVDRDTCATDLLKFLNEMEAQCLVEVRHTA